MLNLYRRIVLIISWMLFALNSSANSKVHNLLEIYHLAEKKNFDFLTQYKNKKIAYENITQAESNFFPEVNFDVHIKKTPAITDLQKAFSLDVEQKILDLNKILNLKNKKIVGEIAELELLKQKQKLMIDVIEAYFAILQLEDELLSAEANEKSLKQQLESNQERYHLGLIIEADVLEAQAAYEMAKAIKIIKQNSLSNNYENLSVITNVDIKDVIRLQTKMPSDYFLEEDFVIWQRKGLENNLDIKKSRKQLELAKINIKSAQSSYFPFISASVNFQADKFDVFQNNPTLSLKMGINLFNGGASNSMVRSMNYYYDNSQYLLDSTQKKVESSIRSIVDGISSNIKVVKARCNGVLFAQSALESIKKGYKVGTRNISNVLSMQQKLFATEADYLKSRYDLIINRMKLKQISGLLDEKDIEYLNKRVKNMKKSSSISLECQEK